MATEAKIGLPILKTIDDFRTWEREFIAWLTLTKAGNLIELEAVKPEAAKEKKEYEENSKKLYAILQLAVDRDIKEVTINEVRDFNGPQAWRCLQDYFKQDSIFDVADLEDELQNLRLKKGENPLNLLSKITSIMNRIGEIEGAHISEDKIKRTLLRKLPYQ